MVRQKMRVRLLVRDVATKRGITRAKLARMADVTYETVFKLWQDEYRDVSLLTLVKLATALKVDVSELYETIPDDDTD